VTEPLHLVDGHDQAARFFDVRADLTVQVRPAGVNPVAADQPGRACGADQVVSRKVREKLRRKIRRRDFDVVVGEHQDLAARPPDAAVVSLAKRPRVVDADDFMRHRAQQRAIVRADLVEAFRVYAADDDRNAAPVARFACRVPRYSAQCEVRACPGKRAAHRGVQYHRISRLERLAPRECRFGGLEFPRFKSRAPQQVMARRQCRIKLDGLLGAVCRLGMKFSPIGVRPLLVQVIDPRRDALRCLARDKPAHQSADHGGQSSPGRIRHPFRR